MAGTTTITVTATDQHGATATTTFDVVIEDNSPPTFDEVPFTRVINVGDADTIMINVTDPDAGDTTTVDIPNPPAWSVWTPDTLSIAGGATVVGDEGNHTVAVQVCDNHGACTTDSFMIVVNSEPTVNAGIPDQNCSVDHVCTF